MQIQIYFATRELRTSCSFRLAAAHGTRMHSSSITGHDLELAIFLIRRVFEPSER